MEGNNVTIPLTEYKRLVSLDGKVQALAVYVRQEEFRVERELISGMLGFELDTRRDADVGIGKPDGRQ